MNRGAGDRSQVADVQKHNGTLREGQPTYSHDEEWETVIPKLPISYRDVSGGETIRGRQMEADTTGLVETAYSPGTRAITAQMRLVMNGRKLNVVNNLDLDGKRRELTIQVMEKR